MLMRAMIDGAVQQGMDREIAERMVYETVSGSVDYAKACGRSLDDIISSICYMNI